MKKAMVIILVATLFFGTLAIVTEARAAAKVGDEGIPADEFIPSNSFEERVGKDSFDSYDEIIGLLQAPEAYAFANIKGSDEPVLLVAEDTFGGDNLGYHGALEATPYIKLADGKFHAGSNFFTISTGTPLAVSADGLVYCATHDSMTTLCLGDNGTGIKGIMCMEYVYTNFGEDGKPDTFGGFIRTENTVVNNDGVAIAKDDEAAFKQAFEDYENCTVIDFIPVK